MTKIKTAGGCPAASYFLLLRQKKVAKEKATPVCRPCGVPCVARLVRRLRNSRFALRQSSPTSPDQPPLLGGAQGMNSGNPKPKIGWAASCPLVMMMSREHEISDVSLQTARLSELSVKIGSGGTFQEFNDVIREQEGLNYFEEWMTKEL